MRFRNRPPSAVGAAVCLAIAGVVIACLVLPPGQPEARSTRRQASHPALYWGAWIGAQLTGEEAPFDMRAASEFERIAGKRMSTVQFASPFANCESQPCYFYGFPTAAMSSLRHRGFIPFFSWASQSVPSTTEEPDFQLSDVIDGRYDSYIRQFAIDAKKWGHPFFLRFNYEMNGDWFPWTEGVNGNQPGQYVAAWRHVHDIFASVGTTNANWVWCPNIDVEHSLQDLWTLYPGNAYVDWSCLDGYNWGTNPNGVDPTGQAAGWKSFNQLFGSTYQQIVQEIAPSKPMIVGETATSAFGGSKGRWIRNLLRDLPARYPRIRGVLFFDHFTENMDWPIETSRSAVKALRRGLRDPAFAPNAYAHLHKAKIRPPRWSRADGRKHRRRYDDGVH